MATKSNMFTKVKADAAKTSAKKNDKLNVVIDNGEFVKDLKDMLDLDEQIDILTARRDIAKSNIKTTGIVKFNDIYQKTGGNPGSFIMSTPDGLSVMFVPSDGYIKCDEARFTELKDTYGDDVVTEKTEMTINLPTLDKPSLKTGMTIGDILSDMIENSTDISDDDKDSLFQAKTSYSVTKGAIDKAFTWGKGKVSDFVRDIQPIFSIKPKAK